MRLQLLGWFDCLSKCIVGLYGHYGSCNNILFGFRGSFMNEAETFVELHRCNLAGISWLVLINITGYRGHLVVSV